MIATTAGITVDHGAVIATVIRGSWGGGGRDHGGSRHRDPDLNQGGMIVSILRAYAVAAFLGAAFFQDCRSNARRCRRRRHR